MVNDTTTSVDGIPVISDPKVLMQYGVCKVAIPTDAIDIHKWATELSQVTPLNMAGEGDGEYAFYRNILEEPDFPFHAILSSTSRNPKTDGASHDGDDEFTLNAGYVDWQDPDDATAGKGVMISFLDKAAASDTEQFTVQYDADRTLWVRRRDGGATPKKTYEAQSTLGNTGGSATATIIDDD